MTLSDLVALSPLIVVGAAAVAIMVVVAFYRSHALTLALTLAALALAIAALPIPAAAESRQVTSLLVVDDYALFFMGLIFAACIAVALLSYAYLERQRGNREEFYLLLLMATFGSAVLVASSHFVSFFLGLEILSVSLYTLIAYPRTREESIEAGLKYLILAGASSAFLLFGIALIYAQLGTMEFVALPEEAASPAATGLWLVGAAMLIVGVGFKLAVVPFHMWTPDVYQGAPAPATAFVATVSKGAMFALLLRYFTIVDVDRFGSLLLIFGLIAVLSMFVGNLLALLQDNVKRLLAYSSIAHLGYLLVAFLASGDLAVTAVAFYLVAYFVTTLGAFGVVAALSHGDGDAEALEDYRGLFWNRPWLAGAFTVMLLSLAGIPLTAGFMGKFYVAFAGVASALWLPVLALVVASAVGVFYYLRVVVAMYARPPEGREVRVVAPSPSLTGSLALAVLTLLLVGLGIYPVPLIQVIQATVGSLV